MNAELALKYLTEMSNDVTQALMLDDKGRVLSTTFKPRSEEESAAADVVGQILDWVSMQEHGNDSPPHQLELATSNGSVFITQGESHSIVAIAGRFALPALILYDMHAVISDLESDEGRDR